MSNARFGLRVRNGLVRGITEGLPAVVDVDALAFIVAAGITNQTQINAINKLVLDLKAFGLWTKMKAIYPFVGGTAATHKWNLKDPTDLDAAFRLVFNGGWTHSANGALPNGTNAYADTFLIPSTTLTNNNTHLSFYSRTSTIINNQRDIAVYYNGNQPAMALGTNTGIYLSDSYSFSTNRITGSIVNASAFFIGTRISNIIHKLYRNGIQLGVTDTSSNSLTLPNQRIYIGAANISPTAPLVGLYSNKQVAFASIGDGLTDTEAANLYTIVQTFQTTLGRQV